MATEYSRVGHIEKMFGQNFSIVTTNAAGSDMLNFDQTSDQTFINSSLIIASPGTTEGIDYGTPSLLVTDYEGHPMRLTYTIKPGNGLVLGYTYSTLNGIKQSNSLDTLSFAIDNDSIQVASEKDGGFVYVSGKGIIEGSYYLQASNANDIDVNINNLIDNNKLRVYNTGDHNRIGVDAQTLIDQHTLKINQNGSDAILNGFETQKISVNLKNIIDNESIVLKQDNKGYNVISVDTSILKLASSNTAGVVKIDDSTIKIKKNGQIYVDTAQLKLVTSSGGKGIVSVGKQGTKSIYVDNNNDLAVDVHSLPKASSIKSGTNKGYGVCTPDDISISASTNGVLSVKSDGLKPATSKTNGVVRPDNTTIKINDAGVISVNLPNLNKASAADFGLVKYDNKSITKNTQGQLCVTNASNWDSAIADIETKITGFAQQIADLKSQLVEFMSTITTKTSVAFTATINNGIDLKSMYLHIPNMTGTTSQTSEWDMSTINQKFTINYGTGYVFRYNISSTNAASWLVGSKIKINGNTYSPNTDIKLTNNSAEATFVFTIQGYGSLKTERPTGVFNITFTNDSGQVIKIITLSIHSCYSIRNASGFKCSMNGSPELSTTNKLIDTNKTTLSTMINTVQPQPVVGTRLPIANTGVVRPQLQTYFNAIDANTYVR